MPATERVVITGLGSVTSLGPDVPTLWEALLAGRSGVRPITHFPAAAFTTQIASYVQGYDPSAHFPVKQWRRMSRFAQLALTAAGEAIADAGIDWGATDRTQVGVLLGNTVGGIEDTEASALLVDEEGPGPVSPFLIVKITPNMAAYAISKHYQLVGYNNTVSTGCAAGTQAIGDAAQIIRHRRADLMISGGTEASLIPTVLAGFCNMQAVSRRNDAPEQASRPFDRDRDGFVPGEGAGIVVLESLTHARRRGAKIYCELVGYGATADAYHFIAPNPTGESAANAMRLALQDAALPPTAIGYVNAHATSTQQGDIAETRAIKTTLGEHAYAIPINSTKSMVGHLLSAAGGVEVVVTAKTLATGWIHPTINLDSPDPECDLDYVPTLARRQSVEYAISNGFGLGGQNASLVLRRWD